MMNMNKKMIMLFVTVMIAANAMAQIPENVKEVLRKSDAKMASFRTSAGVMLDANVKMNVSMVTFNGTMKVCEKNKKFFANMSLKAMQDMELNVEVGFDGQQKWEYTALSGKEKNTLKITKTQDALNKLGPKNNYEKDYKKAKMEESGLYYVITFSEPLKKGVSEKAVVKIVKKSYILHEYSVDEDMGPFKGKITITITKITKGCRDSWFKLDMNRYKNATVVRQ
jgi:hypothetical protein